MKKEKRKSEDSSETVEFISPIKDIEKVIGLSYYSNTVVSHFIVEGVVGKFTLII